MPDDGLTLHDFMPGGDATEGLVGQAGKPLEPGARVADEWDVVDALKTVYDPEIPVNLYDLGLIYNIDVKADGATAITMTLTAPGCPVAGILPQQVADAAAGVLGIGKVEVVLVWDPPWTKDLMSEEARLVLDMF